MQKKVWDQPLENYRYERKFIVERLEEAQIRSLVQLHPAMFVMPYPPRWVNNIYLDTPELANYVDNVDGAVDRRKVRLRWYHGLFDPASQTVLEFKIKRGMVGRKVQYKLGAFQLKEGFSSAALQDFFADFDLPPEVRLPLRSQVPVLVNRYRRWYYATTDGRFRVTVDTKMSFFNIREMTNSFRFHHDENGFKVVELKYQKVDDLEAARIAGYFPFTVYKNSKYVLGMDSVYW